jgi:hypothetical protein
VSDTENIRLADSTHAVGLEVKNRSQQPAPGKGKSADPRHQSLAATQKMDLALMGIAITASR